MKIKILYQLYPNDKYSLVNIKFFSFDKECQNDNDSYYEYIYEKIFEGDLEECRSAAINFVKEFYCKGLRFYPQFYTVSNDFYFLTNRLIDIISEHKLGIHEASLCQNPYDSLFRNNVSVIFEDGIGDKEVCEGFPYTKYSHMPGYIQMGCVKNDKNACLYPRQDLEKRGRCPYCDRRIKFVEE